MIKLKIKKLHPHAVVPKYIREEDACLDITSIENCTIKAKSFYAVHTGIAAEIPKGYEMQIRARSGLAFKNGIGIVNGIGTIDHEYRGELLVILFNMGDEDFKVEKGMRIAQFCLNPVLKLQIEETENLGETTRGENGLGSSGLK